MPLKITQRERQPAPTPIPSYLQRVFDTPELLNRATAIADLLRDDPLDCSLRLLALLSQRHGGWTARVLNAAGFMLLHRAEFCLSARGEARAAA